jgi:predicted O-methyltransferase YrrM
MTTCFADPTVEMLVARLHQQSKAQSKESAAYFARRALEAEPVAPDDADKKSFMSDKLVAIDPDKAQFCYQLCRALDVHRAVEAGTSFGVSTLYIAAALRDNAVSSGGRRVVIGTEYEAAKVQTARTNFAAANLDEFVDLREGDLRETLRDVGGPVDFVLIDIWTRMARPALELVAPHLRPGAIVICDNTESCRDEYDEYFAFIAGPRNRLRTMTLPFRGGLELTVRV